MKLASGMLLAAAIVTGTCSVANAQEPDPHGDPNTGVLRVLTDPPTRGQCNQCHETHGQDSGPGPKPRELFTQNTNQLCFSTDGASGCHQAQPTNYPLDEMDRMPETAPDPGYFEANVEGLRRTGVELRGRWPGERVFSDPGMSGSGHFYSPHAHDTDMPRRDANGEGMCLNCHNPHPTPNPFDLLVATYRGIGGHAAAGPPEQYRLCLQCHGRDGPAGMDLENRYIEDAYDRGLNENAGHRIARNPRIALSWPAHIRTGDMLPCYDCHNPHGSQGNSRSQPNAYALSDQRPGWSGLTSTQSDPEQSRRFCFGCHVPADGVPGSQVVEGIVMNTLSDLEPHRSTAVQGCFECHGNDYSGPTARNVHNPGTGQ